MYLRRAKDFMKRSASQSPDSTLMTFPLALSKNCYSALNLRRSDGGSHKNSIVCCKTGKYLVRSCPSSVCCSQSRLHLRKKSNCHHRQLCTEIIVSHVFCLLSWTPLEKETMLSFLLLYGYASYYYTDRCTTPLGYLRVVTSKQVAKISTYFNIFCKNILSFAIYLLSLSLSVSNWSNLLNNLSFTSWSI